MLAWFWDTITKRRAVRVPNNLCALARDCACCRRGGTEQVFCFFSMEGGVIPSSPSSNIPQAAREAIANVCTWWW